MSKKMMSAVLILILSVMQIAIAAEREIPKNSQLVPASMNLTQTVQKSLEKIITAYTNNDLASVESSIDSRMIGYQELIDGIRQDINRRKNIRIDLRDTMFIANADVAAITINWEKRFIPAAGATTPATTSGHITVLMSRYQDGWKISGITGDNFFIK